MSDYKIYTLKDTNGSTYNKWIDFLESADIPYEIRSFTPDHELKIPHKNQSKVIVVMTEGEHPFIAYYYQCANEQKHDDKIAIMYKTENKTLSEELHNQICLKALVKYVVDL